MVLFLLKWISKLGKVETLSQRCMFLFRRQKLLPSHKEDEELSGIMGVPWHLAVLVHHTFNIWSPEGTAMLCRRHRGDLPWGPESPCMLFLYRHVS